MNKFEYSVTSPDDYDRIWFAPPRTSRYLIYQPMAGKIYKIMPELLKKNEVINCLNNIKDLLII